LVRGCPVLEGLISMTIIAQASTTGGENVGTGSQQAGQKLSTGELRKLSPAIKICPKCYKPKQENEWGFTMCRMCEIGGKSWMK